MNAQSQGSVVFGKILNNRDGYTKRKVGAILDAFRKKLIALNCIKDNRIKRYFCNLLYTTYKNTIEKRYSADVELKTFTLNVLCTMYRKHLESHK